MAGTEIVIDPDKYEKIVKDIDDKGTAILTKTDYVQVNDTETLSNCVIPDYKVAYESMIDEINNLMGRKETIVKLMNNIKDNYDKQVDEAKSQQLQNASSSSSGG